jgi:hypothetical protein
MVPFPRSHFQLVGLPVERSVKFTSKGEHPESGVAEKFAAGCENNLPVHRSNRIILKSLFKSLVLKLLFIGIKKLLVDIFTGIISLMRLLICKTRIQKFRYDEFIIYKQNVF